MLMYIFGIFVKPLMVMTGKFGSNNFGKSAGNNWHLLKRIGTTERNAKRTGDFGIVKADGGKDVGFGSFIGGASSASGNQNSLFFELINQAFSVKTWER